MLLYAQTDEVRLVVEARDLSMSPRSDTVHVTLKITQTVNAYPQWQQDYSATPISVRENAPRDDIVKRLKAVSQQSGQSFVNYVIQVSGVSRAASLAVK